MQVGSGCSSSELENNSRSAAREAAARRRRRGHRAGPPAVQRLFEACRRREVFSGPGTVPPPAGVERIKSVLDSMTAEDVGIDPNMIYFRRANSRGTPRITYLHIYDCQAFSIGIFCLPPRGVIPLHNHPGMTVFSKLLFGSMHVKSYDWAGAAQDTATGPRLAKLEADGVLTAPSETSVLYPEHGGNLHRFTARAACAVLDVLGPPYDNASGRHCQNYRISSSPSSAGSSSSSPGCDGYAWLEECDPPQDFQLIGSTYTGPKVRA